MNNQRKIQELHEQLSDIYKASPYVTIRNTHTENLWRQIEIWSAAESYEPKHATLQ